MFQNLLWVYGMAWMSVRFPGLKFCPSPPLMIAEVSGMVAMMVGSSGVASMMSEVSGMAAMLWTGSGVGITGQEGTL